VKKIHFKLNLKFKSSVNKNNLKKKEKNIKIILSFLLKNKIAKKYYYFINKFINFE